MLTMRWACGQITGAEGMSPQLAGSDRSVQWSINVSPLNPPRGRNIFEKCLAPNSASPNYASLNSDPKL